MVKIGVIGAGYWGKNLVRVFNQIPGARLVACCDASATVRAKLAKQYPEVAFYEKTEQLLSLPEIQAVVIATPAVTHAEVSMQAFKAGKHVYIEKPLALNPKEGEQIISLAQSKNLILMVGHLLLYHPGVLMLKQLIQSGELGDIRYLYSQRVNLGIIRKDENAMWSLAPHDVSIMLHLLDEDPVSVSARGASYIQKDIQDVVFLNLEFSNGKMGQIHVSWLDPHKIRKLTVVGSKKMVTFDDMETSEKIRIYDKSANTAPDYQSYGEYITLRSGDIHIPQISSAEPLILEAEHFVDCVANNKQPRSDGRDGLRVLKTLYAAEQSMRNQGAPVSL